MTDFKLLVSFDGALSVVRMTALDVNSAMVEIRNMSPDRTAVLVKTL